MSENITVRSHVASKVHGCDFCGGRIEPGERYQVTVYKDGRDLCTWKEHGLCGQFFVKFCKDSCDVGEIWEALRSVTLADVSGTDWGTPDNNSRAVAMWHEANDD